MQIDKPKIAFVGLGVMGYPMAGHLSQAGLDVTVYNRTQSKAQQWMNQHQGKVESTPEDAARDADIVMICVGNDHDLSEVTEGKHGVIKSMQPGSVLVDHTTASAEMAEHLHAMCQSKGIGFIDAPVSGGQAGAENGLLTIMAGGDQNTFDGVNSILMHYARCVRLLGPAGSGQKAKMMNQICIAGVLQGLAEALHFGQKAGLDCEAVVEVISQGAAQSWQMENRAKTMLKDEYNFGFAVDWMRKDLSIALNEARKNGATLSLTALVDQYYGDVQKIGGGRFDTSSLLKRLD